MKVRKRRRKEKTWERKREEKYMLITAIYSILFIFKSTIYGFLHFVSHFEATGYVCSAKQTEFVVIIAEKRPKTKILH
jgi:hypothetical protein